MICHSFKRAEPATTAGGHHISIAPKDDDPDALCLGHFDHDPEQLHEDDGRVHEVHPLLEEDEVVDGRLVGEGAALQEEVNLDGDVGPQNEG